MTISTNDVAYARMALAPHRGSRPIRLETNLRETPDPVFPNLSVV